MKRIIFLSTLMLCLFLGNMILADQSTLIDFSLLGKDFPSDSPKYNKRTTVSFKDQAGSSFSDEEKRLMLVSLSLDEWTVDLASSSKTTARIKNSICKEAKTTANNVEELKEKTILGVRVMYPESNFNSFAIVKPPFEVQAYQDLETLQDDYTFRPDEANKGKGNMFADGYGVVRNIGTLKDISVTVYGANFPHSLEIILQDENFEQKRYHMCYLNYDGWKTHTWTNPNYIENVRQRELKLYPLYPRETPYLKFIGFVLYRDANSLGGDFIVYVKDIKITYDKAVADIDSPLIDDEAIWGILDARAQERRTIEYKRLGAQQVMQYLEKSKMDTTGSTTGTN